MATAEELLNEAQYAYQNISFGESRDNRRNRSRATSYSKKIIRKYPTSTEAEEARAILRRLGEEGYSSKSRIRHTHSLPDAPKAAQHSHGDLHARAARSARQWNQETFAEQQDDSLDLVKFLGWLFGLPRFVHVGLIFAGFFLYSVFGLLLLLPLGVLIVLVTPLRRLVPAEMRREADGFLRSVNEWVADQEKNSP